MGRCDFIQVEAGCGSYSYALSGNVGAAITGISGGGFPTKILDTRTRSDGVGEYIKSRSYGARYVTLDHTQCLKKGKGTGCPCAFNAMRDGLMCSLYGGCNNCSSLTCGKNLFGQAEICLADYLRPENAPCKLTRITCNDKGGIQKRCLEVEFVGAGDDFIDMTGLNACTEQQLTFIAPYPYAFDCEAQNWCKSGGGSAEDLVEFINCGTGAKECWRINYEGCIASKPRIMVQNLTDDPINGFSVTHEGTGATVKLDYQLCPNESVTLDFQNNKFSDMYGRNLLGRNTTGGTCLANFELLPYCDDNLITFRGFKSANVNICITWFNWYPNWV